ncbi:BnaA02g08070D [Brassica napus]|uniref:BnaA02g08070D protein n=1 Tax=Brassica napus TaxID=3708 RepID=A0A078H298_BRANA|nr:BnaA02g08070D [Brassica napus]
MDSKGDDGSREMLLKLQEKIEKATSELKAKPQIRDAELDKVFDAEEVGHVCDLCDRDLASDPERPNASLRSLQEACVLACGHVYHFKCLRGTTLDLDNPSCILCIR